MFGVLEDVDHHILINTWGGDRKGGIGREIEWGKTKKRDRDKRDWKGVEKRRHNYLSSQK